MEVIDEGWGGVWEGCVIPITPRSCQLWKRWTSEGCGCCSTGRGYICLQELRLKLSVVRREALCVGLMKNTEHNTLCPKIHSTDGDQVSVAVLGYLLLGISWEVNEMYVTYSGQSDSVQQLSFQSCLHSSLFLGFKATNSIPHQGPPRIGVHLCAFMRA